MYVKRSIFLKEIHPLGTPSHFEDHVIPLWISFASNGHIRGWSTNPNPKSEPFFVLISALISSLRLYHPSPKMLLIRATTLAFEEKWPPI